MSVSPAPDGVQIHRERTGRPGGVGWTPARQPAAPGLVGRGCDRWGELTASFVSGDRTALEQLYRRSASSVHTVALRALGDQARADEVTRRTFVAAWLGRLDFRPDRTTLLTWLMHLADAQITAEAQITTGSVPHCATDPDPAPSTTHRPSWSKEHPC